MSSSPTLRERLDHLWEWVESACVEVPGVRTFLLLWRKLGFVGTLLVLAVVGYPIGEYSLISMAVNRTVPKLAGNFGMDFDADWSYHPFAMKAIARNVKIKPEHPAAAAPLFTASEIEFQGSIASTLSTVWDAVRFRSLHTFNEITVRNGELHLERSLNGTMNVAEYWDRMNETKRSELKSGLYHINALNLDDVKVHYIERVPGHSGGGVIETTQVNIHIDAISGSLTDIRPVDIRDAQANAPPRMPTNIWLTGRSSDGTLEVQGSVAFIEDDPGRQAPKSERLPDPRTRRVSDAELAVSATETPLYELHVRLTNIGAAAFTRTLPGLELVATRGVVQGNIVFRDHEPTCKAAATMVDVQYAPNPNVVFVPARYEAIRQQQNWSHTGEYDPCRGLIAAAPALPVPKNASRTGVAGAVLAFTRQSTETAPPAIRAAAVRDEQRIAGESITYAALAETSNRIAQSAGRVATKLAGPRIGGALQQSMSSDPNAGASTGGQQATNPLAKGAKSVGHGLKRLFGGSGDPKDKPKR
jgi:hypothetical protein